MASKVISTRLDDAQVAHLDLKASESGVTRNELIAKILLDFLGNPSTVDVNVDKSIRDAVDKAVDARILQLEDRICGKVRSLLESKGQSAKEPEQQAIATKSISDELSTEKLKPLDVDDLAKRLGYGRENLRKYQSSKNNDARKLANYTKKDDPNGIAWRYEDSDKLYYPIK